MSDSGPGQSKSEDWDMDAWLEQPMQDPIYNASPRSNRGLAGHSVNPASAPERTAGKAGPEDTAVCRLCKGERVVVRDPDVPWIDECWECGDA